MLKTEKLYYKDGDSKRYCAYKHILAVFFFFHTAPLKTKKGSTNILLVNPLFYANTVAYVNLYYSSSGAKNARILSRIRAALDPPSSRWLRYS